MLLSVAVQIPSWTLFQSRSSDERSSLRRIVRRTIEIMQTLLTLANLFRRRSAFESCNKSLQATEHKSNHQGDLMRRTSVKPPYRGYRHQNKQGVCDNVRNRVADEECIVANVTFGLYSSVPESGDGVALENGDKKLRMGRIVRGCILVAESIGSIIETAYICKSPCGGNPSQDPSLDAYGLGIEYAHVESQYGVLDGEDH